MLKNARKELVMNINSVAVAEVMNDYFSSVFTRKDDNNHVEMMPEMGEVCFTRWKVRKRVRKLRAMTAAGLDGIGPKDLQELEKKSVDGLTMILRRELSRTPETSVHHLSQQSVANLRNPLYEKI
jgi:hypothetical protein